MELEKTVFVNAEKMDTKENLEQAYMELGQAYYEGGFEDPLPQLLPLFDKITRIKNEIKAAGEPAEALVSEPAPAARSAVHMCPQCGSTVNEGEKFCGVCGMRRQ